MKRATIILLLSIASMAFFFTGSSAQGPALKKEAFASKNLIDPDSQNFAEIKALLEKGADVNQKDADGATALMKAAYLGNFQLVKLLVDKGADVNASDNSGITALMNAAVSADLETVKLIAGRVADINVRDDGGATALMYAALSPRDDPAAAKYLIEKGADAGAQDFQGYSALSIAENHGKEELANFLKSLPAAGDPRAAYLYYALGALASLLILKIAIAKLFKKSETRSSNKKKNDPKPPVKTPEPVKVEKNVVDLFEAVAREDLETLKRLIAEGGNPDSLDQAGRSLLSAAACRGLDNIIAFLIESKVNVNFQDSSGKTALMFAVGSSPIATVRLLIGAGADVNLRDNEGRSAYAIASDKKNIKILNLLKAAGADEAADERPPAEAAAKSGDARQNGAGREEALLGFAAEGNLDEIRGLISKNVNVNAADANGNTALLIASGAGRLDIMKTLIDAGAGVNLANGKGITPLIIAAAKGHAKAVILLIKAGADFNAKTKNGLSALKCSAEKGFNDIAAALKKAGADQ